MEESTRLSIQWVKKGKKYLENVFFSRLGKIEKFCGWSCELGKDGEVRKKIREFENVGLQLRW